MKRSNVFRTVLYLRGFTYYKTTLRRPVATDIINKHKYVVARLRHTCTNFAEGYLRNLPISPYEATWRCLITGSPSKCLATLEAALIVDTRYDEDTFASLEPSE